MHLHELTMEQYLSWERDGYLAIEDFLSEEELLAYNTAMDATLAAWKAKGHIMPSNIDKVSSVIEHGEIYLALMEHPRMMGIMRDVIGDAFTMIDNELFIKHPGQVTHANWHRDTATTMLIGGKRVPFMVKVFYFTADVPYDGGCLSFLPGSRHMHDDVLPSDEAGGQMPGHVRMNVKAGTAVLFDGATYHAAMDNTSNQQRRSLIYNYGPLFLKQWPGYEPSAALLGNKENTPLRNMLLGASPWPRDPRVFQ
ncbi:phytanoyl-CoA dioxygenase family protein [Paenibacillus sp. CF384]|uniref:phytanoyl-CoA dioxygenase family protein n=1 Tax=Paenibacillus sp. CF384 TaxID=1884382 RepID=UPI000894F1D5|nr:phytanoyl-CoA dioxygenase family protein [Paenibacillus sp. CF384]SDX46499.1 Ectoine hydroxylase-related dioxygenase, phytanoyl-CoA dioxygenase (PhyH) family [Paenibacillus sp. CF384]